MMNIIYDVKNNELAFEHKIPFSDIEHDTNRKYTERVCIDMMLDFKRKKKRYIKLLSNPRASKYKSKYKKYISILNGEFEYDDQDIFVLISILGRLEQESKMGPIMVMKDEKLNPDKVTNHTTLKGYIVACVNTVKEYSNSYLINSEQMKMIGGLGFGGLLDKKNIKPNPIPLLSYSDQTFNHIINQTSKLKGNVYSSNYIESFFKKLIDIPKYHNVVISIDNYQDVLQDLMDFGRKFRGSGEHEFIILEKVKNILLSEPFDKVMVDVKQVYKSSTRKTYYKQVADHLLNLEFEELQKREFYKLVVTYENYIASELAEYISSKERNSEFGYSDCEIAISSDMHFNNLDNIYKENYSSNFNIIAGDFYNNSYHRAGFEITDSFPIEGIGVIGNHDVTWIDSVKDIIVQVKTKYKKSIELLNRYFPNIKILNNEVYYKNGIAFVGVTIVVDESEIGKRLFFANEKLGYFFKKEDYIKTTKKLLDSVDKNIPIVVVTHSPFKEYAVCKNKNIGVISNHIFRNYPNVRMYIHGHGHSSQNSKMIEGVYCVSNPIVNNIYSDSLMDYEWEDIKCGSNNKKVSEKAKLIAINDFNE